MVGQIFGSHDEKTLTQLHDVASRAVRTALMADGHLGYIMPIGGVAAYRNQVSVAGVGFDIACGNAAIRTDMTLEQVAGLSPVEIQSNPSMALGNRVLDDLAHEIQTSLSFGIGRKNETDDAPVDHALFQDPAWYAVPNTAYRAGRDELMAKARRQLGTVGSGNHYVDVFYDTHGTLWVGVHFGSRGLGHTIASNFMAMAKGLRWGEKCGSEVEALLDLDTPMGHDYWQLMNLAGRYAYAGREWVARKVVQILGAQEVELIHNHHNFAWKEQQLGPNGIEELVVVRKGATPAFPGQTGFVGGSMGDDSVILKGADAPNPEGFGEAEEAWHARRAKQHQALFSTVHGAGRVMSRTEAAGKRHRKTGQVLKPGKVSPEMMRAWLREKGVILRGGGLDESPHAYRRLPDVLRDQESTIEVLETLTPLVVVMAGADEFDPYKD